MRPLPYGADASRMRSIMSAQQSFKDHIGRRLSTAAAIPAEQIATSLEIPPDEKMGDYAFPCFSLAKERRMAPPKIAAELAAQLGPDDLLEEVTSKGPYVNFKLRTVALVSRVLVPLLANGDQFAAGGHTGTIIVDFSSPNIAKPFHVGHLRSTVLGNALNRILRYLGFKTIAINHLGDWGTQFGFLMAGWESWGSEPEMPKNPIAHLYDIYVKANAAAAGETGMREEPGISSSRLRMGIRS